MLVYVIPGSKELQYCSTAIASIKFYTSKEISTAVNFQEFSHLLFRAVCAVKRRQHGRNAAQLPDAVPGESDVSPLAIQRRLALGLRRLLTRSNPVKQAAKGKEQKKISTALSH